jgi:DNA-binding FadR family transcriptional regulator
MIGHDWRFPCDLALLIERFLVYEWYTYDAVRDRIGGPHRNRQVSMELFGSLAQGTGPVTALDPIRRQKVYEEIARRLEEQILDGRLQPGDVLPSERELMERHGVGRPAVREALMSLQKSGLIAIQNGERARVVRPSAMSLVGELGSAARYLLNQTDGIRQFQQARLFFEVGLVRFAAERGTEVDLQRLGRALAANEAAIADMAAFARTDVDFHFVLAEIPRNPIFVAMHIALAEWLTEQRVSTLRQRGVARAALKSHRAIFKAIEARDPDQAEAAMRDHLGQVEELYWKSKPAEPQR